MKWEQIKHKVKRVETHPYKDDEEQATQSIFLNHIKTLVWIRLMVIYEHGTQGFGPPKSLLT